MTSSWKFFVFKFLEIYYLADGFLEATVLKWDFTTMFFTSTSSISSKLSFLWKNFFNISWVVVWKVVCLISTSKNLLKVSPNLEIFCFKQVVQIKQGVSSNRKIRRILKVLIHEILVCQKFENKFFCIMTFYRHKAIFCYVSSYINQNNSISMLKDFGEYL